MNEDVRVLGTLKAVFAGEKKGQTKQKFDLPTMVGKREKFVNQFVEDLRRLAELNKYSDSFKTLSLKDESSSNGNK